MQNINHIKAYCLIAILILGVFLYFYNLGKESLLTDEYLSLHVTQQPIKNIIFAHNRESNPNTIPPLYEIILHFWLKIFGSGEFAQRSLSAMFGILSIYVLYRLARLLFDAQTGLLSALFSTFSFSWFYYFRQNRCYSLFILLTLISFYSFFYHLKNKNSELSLVGLITVNILLTFTHYFSFLIIGLQVLFSSLHWKTDRRLPLNILFMCMWVGLVYLPWYPNFLYDCQREPVLFYKTAHFNIAWNLFDIMMILFFDFHFRWDLQPAVLAVLVIMPFLLMRFFPLH